MFPHCPRPGPLQECGHTAHNHLAWGMQRVVWTDSQFCYRWDHTAYFSALELPLQPGTEDSARAESGNMTPFSLKDFSLSDVVV